MYLERRNSQQVRHVTRGKDLRRERLKHGEPGFGHAPGLRFEDRVVVMVDIEVNHEDDETDQLRGDEVLQHCSEDARSKEDTTEFAHKRDKPCKYVEGGVLDTSDMLEFLVC